MSGAFEPNVYLYRCADCMTVQATHTMMTPETHAAYCFVCRDARRFYPIHAERGFTSPCDSGVPAPQRVEADQ